VQLDWKEKNKKAMLASAGLASSEGTFKCGKCGSRNTDYTQKQTRSADEPMTTCVPRGVVGRRRGSD
jgi:DNA-directed RNA polymerase subunit M/transcription elongation factor TFIIS